MEIYILRIYTLIFIFGNSLFSVYQCYQGRLLRRIQRFDPEFGYSDKAENEIEKPSVKYERPVSAGDDNTCGQVRRPPKGLRSFYRLRSKSYEKAYEKYTEAYNIPILASPRVSDRAVRRACYVVRFLLADRKDIREAFFRRRAAVVVVGASESLSDLKGGPFNRPTTKNARYIVATQDRPYVVGAEESLLCQRDQPDEPDDVFLKAMAMSIVNVATGDVIPHFRKALHEAFEDGVASDWWDGLFASDSLTYFGEGTQSFYNVNNYGRYDRVMNRVSLATHDSLLYRLILNVFPCADVYQDRCNSRGFETFLEVETNCHVPGDYVI